MGSLWIIHRDPQERAALARLAGASDAAVLAGPGDPQLATLPPPDAVLLALGDDAEAELQLAHRQGPRLIGARWVILAPERDGDRVARLFDTLDCRVLPHPPDARALRRALAAPAPPVRGEPLPLSQRPARDRLSERFARWFADLELPELLRLLDPRLLDVPALVCGEPGTGRALLTRYLHAFGGTAAGPLARAICGSHTSPAELLEQLAGPGTRGTAGCVWLDGVDRLPAATQRAVAGWVEYGCPELGLAQPRWVGTAGPWDEALEPELLRVLGLVRIDIPPLRERTALIAPFVTETAQAWCAARDERLRRFGEDAMAVLEEHPWPGNLAELEATVIETLLHSSGSPIRADDLQCGGVALAPLDAEAIGVRLVEGAAAPGDEADAAAAEVPGAEAAFEPESPAATPPAAEPELLETIAVEESGLRNLAAAVAHEVRNPLTTIRNFTALLPENYADPDFRGRFGELVDASVERIEAVVEQLAALAARETPGSHPVDVTALLEELIADQRDAIRDRRLVVLKELERASPDALGDRDQLRACFAALLRKCLELAPDRGDLYVASRHHAKGLRGRPSLRILVRFSGPRVRVAGGPAPVAGVSPAENALEFATVEAVARAHGGALAIQSGEGDETVVVVDLPAPG